MFRLTLASLVLAACHDTTIVVGDLQEVASLRAVANRNLDILFVIDNSASTADKQASLAANFPRMMDVLGQLDGGLPSLHIGVVTSDMGTSGSGGAPAPAVGQVGQGGCSGTGDDGILHVNPAMLDAPFIVDVDDGQGGRTRNYTGELRTVFAGVAQVGETGCGFEQHLAAMRRALTNPANAGFLRPEANLAVIIIADEDDCSVLDPANFFSPLTDPLGPLQSFRCTRAGVHCNPDMTSIGNKTGCEPAADSSTIENVQPFIDALLAVKADPRYLMVAGIIGDPAPVAVEVRNISGENQLALAHSCAFDGPAGPEVADPGVRLASFLDGFPERSTLTSICSADLSVALGTIGESAKKLVGDPCLDTSKLADSSPAPGIQPACEVLDIRDSTPNTPVSLPACAPDGENCYELVPDAVACPASADHLRIRFRRTKVVADDTWTSVRCQLRS